MWTAWLRTHIVGPELYDAALNAVENVWRKAQLYTIGSLHFFFSRDMRWPRLSSSVTPPVLPSSGRVVLPYGSDAIKTWKKRILFVRHAESEWNVVFNRGVWWLAIVRFFRAVVREWLMLPTFDSIFIDSPLSRFGVGQARALYSDVVDVCTTLVEINPPPRHWLQYLGTAMPNSIVVSSNLRRAIDTARVASATRLESRSERLHVLSCLQEVGRNIDTIALSEAYSSPPQTLPREIQGEKKWDELFNLAESHGNKGILGCARSRLLAFAQWTFFQPHDVVVVFGHSHWFRAFCKEFFPAHTVHPAKETKLLNCEVVTFELEERRSDNAVHYVIPTTSFEYVR